MATCPEVYPAIVDYDDMVEKTAAICGDANLNKWHVRKYAGMTFRFPYRRETGLNGYDRSPPGVYCGEFSPSFVRKAAIRSSPSPLPISMPR